MLTFFSGFVGVLIGLYAANKCAEKYEATDRGWFSFFVGIGWMVGLLAAWLSVLAIIQQVS